MKELAAHMGVNKDTALKRCKALQRKSGMVVLIRLSNGKRAPWFTTRSMLQKADPRWMEEQAIATSEIEELKAAYARTNAELRRLIARVRALELAAKR